ncbi:MAG: HNH endonuclease [Bacteroidetes bacterium]|nr:HNH endonuclease [Bacteroidota bacterium]
MNWVKANRKELSVKNYVRKADSKTNYWLDLSQSKIQAYDKSTNGDFNIIFYGDEVVETDFYVIPYQEIKHLLSESNFPKTGSRKRWIGNIINHQIVFSNSGIRLNVSQFHSFIPNLYKAQTILDTVSDTDYAIENAKREILIRINQSLFRNKVLANFQGQCCLTQITEKSLLIASHIIPWSAQIETRLSPHNGLCLSILYDRLFDKGFFTLSDSLEVIITPKIGSLSFQTQKCLKEIHGRKIAIPKNYEISSTAIKYHRQNIFDRFQTQE